MIELKNVSKSYKSKKGDSTIALNNVSINFEDKGMVFILGKSGSGKSTLLNVLGGLDKYDSGDMSILGKSSKDFTVADFDSYRNTYIGFVFQEFNILEDYNVYENIVLALQLQQKDVDDDKINALLEKLELKDLKERKVNELSGGQKQRVAIARALVKKPKIILADEPTGNLDSATGRGVMDLLKEISREKLVVIVSHDSESAKLYADRIVEIKDGSIISDVNNIQKTNEISEEYKIVKSHLPLKESLKLGVGSLKHKKIKLVFTILLTIFTLLFLSLTDTLSSHDIEKAHAKVLKEKNEEFLQIEKYKNYENIENYYNRENVNLNETDTKIIKDYFDKDIYEIYKVKTKPYDYSDMFEIFKIGFSSSNNNLYTIDYTPLEVVVAPSVSSILKEQIIGREPESNNEVVITNYLANMIMEYGIVTYEKEDEFMEEPLYKPKSYQELLESNKTFYFGNIGKIKIVGIIEYDLNKYEILKEKNYENITNEEGAIYEDFYRLVSNVYSKIYVTDEFINTIDMEEIETVDQNNQYQLESTAFNTNQEYYVPVAILNHEIEYYDGTTWKKTSKLNENEMLLGIKNIGDLDYDNYLKNLNSYISNNSEKDKNELEKEFFENYIKDYDLVGKDITIKVKDRYGENEQEYEGIKIIGLIGYTSENAISYNYFSLDDLKEYKPEAINKQGFLVPVTSEKEFKSILEEFKYNEELSAESTYSRDVIGLIETMNVLKKVGFYISVVLAVFAIFLIANFVMSSINYRKKEIGVLRSLGARSKDIMKIFLWEGIIMSLISAIITSILLIFVSSFLNGFIMGGVSIILTPFIVGIRQFIMIFLLVFVVTMISSIVPIIKISRMKPIDAILKK